MDDERSLETIKIYYKDEYGYETEMSKTFEAMPDIGVTTIDEIAIAINNFMKAAGYPSYDKYMVFLESVDEDEYEYLLDVLRDRREAMETCKTCDDYIYNDGHCYGGVLECDDYIPHKDTVA